MADTGPSTTSDTNTTSRPAHLEPSKLGTKQYWDALYATELTNHAHDPSDTGTAWFDDSDAEAKLLSHLDEQHHTDLRRETASFLDLGCGNGALLLALRADGWRGRMLGVDYSAASVDLARRVAAAAAAGEDDDDDDDDDTDGTAAAPAPEFAEWDVLRGPLATVLGDGDGDGGEDSAGGPWDVVLDKGTFDAVSLGSERARDCAGYGARVLRVLREGGVFLVTSCNWTEAELKGWFEEEEEGGDAQEDGGGAAGTTTTTTTTRSRSRLVQVGRVQYPCFEFGGVKGQTISTVCFRKKTTTGTTTGVAEP